LKKRRQKMRRARQNLGNAVAAKIGRQVLCAKCCAASLVQCSLTRRHTALNGFSSGCDEFQAITRCLSPFHGVVASILATLYNVFSPYLCNDEADNMEQAV